MKIAELRQMSAKDLWKKLSEIRRDRSVARFHVKTGQEQNTAKIRKAARLVAQIKFLLHNEK